MPPQRMLSANTLNAKDFALPSPAGGEGRSLSAPVYSTAR